MAPKDLRGKVAIVGASESDEMGKLPDKSVLTLHAESIRNALDDAGLKLSDVDGLFMAGGSPETTVNDLCEYLGVMPRYADSTIVGGCSFIMHVEARDAGPQRGLDQHSGHQPRRKRPVTHGPARFRR